MGRRGVELPGEVVDLRGRIEGWRLARVGRARMPEDLWCEALTWARIYGACAISKALGIGYAGLRTRLESVPRGDGTGGEAMGGGFVEVGNPWAGSAPSTLEVIGREGCRLTLSLAPGCCIDVAGVVAAFLAPSA